MIAIDETYVRECFAGARLFGDDFDESQIENWYRQEEHAYFELSDGKSQKFGAYDALNWRALFRFIIDRHFKTCLGLGSANGNDIAPMAPYVDRFVVIEPSEKFWVAEIGGKPARYIKPAASGRIPFEDATFELVVAVSVLHHLPNVSLVLSELVRVLKPGGILLVREPITSMGDWRKPRIGLTPNERGLPVDWLLDSLKRNNVSTLAACYCMFAPFGWMWRKLEWLNPYNRTFLVLIDLLTSALTGFNYVYHRTNAIQKIAPSAISIVARKP